MKAFNSFKQAIIQSIRILMIAFVCTLFFFSNMAPTLAAGNPKSSPYEDARYGGQARLDETQDASEEALRESGLPSMKQVIERSKGGVNEIQGSADKDKMKTPENSQGAVSVEEAARNALDKITPGTPGMKDSKGKFSS